MSLIKRRNATYWTTIPNLPYLTHDSSASGHRRMAQNIRNQGGPDGENSLIWLSRIHCFSFYPFVFETLTTASTIITTTIQPLRNHSMGNNNINQHRQISRRLLISVECIYFIPVYICDMKFSLFDKRPKRHAHTTISTNPSHCHCAYCRYMLFAFKLN
uniref:Uncharacterized protein n=1 Tax=Glossina brevipalpis TaxID=37001 RepID=A0A1A9WZJ4_9MUSC